MVILIALVALGRGQQQRFRRIRAFSQYEYTAFFQARGEWSEVILRETIVEMYMPKRQQALRSVPGT